MPIMEPPDGMDPLRRLSKDLKDAAATLTTEESRYLVDYYYQMQRDRIRADNQTRSQDEEDHVEPHAVLRWVASNTGLLENQIKRALDAYTDAQVVGRWAKSICGIGPVLSAGLLAHIDIEQAPTVGHIWRFAGLDPTQTWGKGEKRPWNGRLKTLCWKIGESFVKVAAKEDDVYGKLYLHRKAIEQAKNEAGDFAAQAAQSLAAKRFGADTQARKHYEAGQLPPARIHLRSTRWAVKIFLAHYHHVAYESRYGTPPPKPYVLTQLGHAHEIVVPHWPLP